MTLLGRLFATAVAVLGVGMFALPAGVLGAGFVDELDRRRQVRKTCPHCGEPLDD